MIEVIDETLLSRGRFNGMAQQHHRAIDEGGDFVVGRPRATDGIGQALRRTFAIGYLPADMQAALRRLDATRRR